MLTCMPTDSMYQIRDHIATGGLAQVYHAIHVPSGTDCVFKYMSCHDEDETNTLFMAHREVGVMRWLQDHPNILRIFDHWEAHRTIPREVGPPDTEWHIGIVSESCSIDLHDLMASVDVLTPTQVQLILFQLVAALAYTHSARIMHRDLKPSNILLSKRGIVKICDFGWAKPCEMPHPRTHETVERNSRSNVPAKSRQKRPSTDLSPSLATNMQCCDPEIDVKEHASWMNSTHSTDEEGDEEDDENNPPNIGSAYFPPLISQSLTLNLCTVWYVSPEMMLTPKEYSLEHDLWSLGCIFAELLACLPGGVPVSKRGAVFRGSGSSALQLAKGQQISDLPVHHQLRKIIDTQTRLPTPSIEAYSSPELQRSLRAYVSQSSSKNTWGSRFSHSSPDAQHLLHSMLSFHPSHRPCALDILQHPYLRELTRRFQPVTQCPPLRALRMDHYDEYFAEECSHELQCMAEEASSTTPREETREKWDEAEKQIQQQAKQEEARVKRYVLESRKRQKRLAREAGVAYRHHSTHPSLSTIPFRSSESLESTTTESTMHSLPLLRA